MRDVEHFDAVFGGDCRGTAFEVGGADTHYFIGQIEFVAFLYEVAQAGSASVRIIRPGGEYENGYFRHVVLLSSSYGGCREN